MLFFLYVMYVYPFFRINVIIIIISNLKNIFVSSSAYIYIIHNCWKYILDVKRMLHRLATLAYAFRQFKIFAMSLLGFAPAGVCTHSMLAHCTAAATLHLLSVTCNA